MTKSLTEKMTRAAQVWARRDTERLAREEDRAHKAEMQRALMEVERQKALYAQQVALANQYQAIYGQQVYNGNLVQAQTPGGYGVYTANTSAVNATVPNWVQASGITTTGVTVPAQNTHPWQLANVVQTMPLPQGYMQYTGYQEPAKPKPVPMDPPFSLDELEAAQDFIDALGAA